MSFEGHPTEAGPDSEGRGRAAESPGALRRIGRYVVLGVLGRGGMGTVLEAFDPTLDRRVAIKVLDRDLSARGARRLVREAQAMAKLSHPNVVQVFEAGEADGWTFIAMELVRGQTLQAFAAGRPAWPECVRAYLQAGEGLAAAHAEGLVHRDFKPSNCIIDDKGRVRVLDFGLVRWAEEGDPATGSLDDEPRADPHEAASTAPLTRTGSVMGTPAYMSLEQMQGRVADARSDQFGFCVSLYEALYGERPFAGDAMGSLMLALLRGEVRPAPKGSTVPEPLRRVLLRGLASDPAQRWPTMDVLLAELRALVEPGRRRWRIGGVVALSVGLVAAGVGLVRQVQLREAERQERCSGAAQQLEGVWDDARRREVEDALLATAVPYAADTWALVEPRLDGYADAWVRAHTEICEATRVTEAQTEEVMELRMACLGRQRIELREAVGVLTRADRTTVERAVALAASLPDPAECDDVEALRADAPVPAALAEPVAQLRERLSGARARLVAADYDGGLAEAQAVVDAAESLQYEPLLARALLARGRARAELDELTAAEQDLERAYLLAVEHRLEPVELDAAVVLSYVVGREQARLEPGLQWGKIALALAERSGTSAGERGHAWSGVGGVLATAGKWEQAYAHEQQALVAMEAEYGPDHPEVATVLSNLGSTRLRLGDLDEALALGQRALTIAEATLGPKHPDVGVTAYNIARVLSAQGQREEALAYHRRALATLEAALGPDHTEVGMVLNSMATDLRAQGQREEALALHQRALAIAESALGPDHPEVAIALHGLANTTYALGRFDEALGHYERALAIAEATLGPKHPNLASSLVNVGAVLYEQGKLDEAVGYYRRALAIQEETLGPDHPDVAYSLFNLGEVLVKQGDPARGRDHYERALAIFETKLGLRHPNVAFACIDLAEIGLALGDVDTARAHAERAVEILEAGEPSPERLAAAHFALARTLGPEQAPRARTLAERARDAFAAAGPIHEPRRVEVDAWLARHPAR